MVSAYPNFLPSQLPNFHLDEGGRHPDILTGLTESPRRVSGAVRKTGAASHFLRCQNGTNGPFRQSLPYNDPVVVSSALPFLHGP